MPHITSGELVVIFDVAARVLTFATAAISAWQAYRAKVRVRENTRRLDVHSDILNSVVEQVNGRMSEIISRIPEPHKTARKKPPEDTSVHLPE